MSSIFQQQISDFLWWQISKVKGWSNAIPSKTINPHRKQNGMTFDGAVQVPCAYYLFILGTQSQIGDLCFYCRASVCSAAPSLVWFQRIVWFENNKRRPFKVFVFIGQLTKRNPQCTVVEQVGRQGKMFELSCTAEIVEIWAFYFLWWNLKLWVAGKGREMHFREPRLVFGGCWMSITDLRAENGNGPRREMGFLSEALRSLAAVEFCDYIDRLLDQWALLIQARSPIWLQSDQFGEQVLQVTQLPPCQWSSLIFGRWMWAILSRENCSSFPNVLFEKQKARGGLEIHFLWFPAENWVGRD